MKTVDEIRWENLLLLIAEAGGDEKLAELYGCTVPYIRQMKLKSKDSETGRPKGIGTSTARKLEAVCGKKRGWIDQDHANESITSLTETLAKQIEEASPEVRTVIMTLLMRYQTDKVSGDETARAIKTLLGIRNGDTPAG